MVRAGEEKQTAQRKRREKWRNKMVVVLSIDEQLQISRRLYPIPHLSIFVMRAIKFRRIGYPLSLGRSESLRNLRAWVKSSRLSLSLLRLFVWLSLLAMTMCTAEAQCSQRRKQNKKISEATKNSCVNVFCRKRESIIWKSNDARYYLYVS